MVKDIEQPAISETVSFTKDGSSGRELKISHEHLTEALRSYFLTKPLIAETEQITDVWSSGFNKNGTYFFTIRIEEA